MVSSVPCCCCREMVHKFDQTGLIAIKATVGWDNQSYTFLAIIRSIQSNVVKVQASWTTLLCFLMNHRILSEILIPCMKMTFFSVSRFHFSNYDHSSCTYEFYVGVLRLIWPFYGVMTARVKRLESVLIYQGRQILCRTEN